MLHAHDAGPTLWFPSDDVDATAVPHGTLQHFAAGGDPVAVALGDFLSLDPSAADRWFLEDEPVYSHVRDPYHRVDVLSSHRHVRVALAGMVIAETNRPKLLFETGLPARYYIPWADVRLELLELSPTVSECPYKGDGQHWHLSAGGEHVSDAAWSLPHPLPEGIPAAEHVCFYQNKLAVTVDGTRLE